MKNKFWEAASLIGLFMAGLGFGILIGALSAVCR